MVNSDGTAYLEYEVRNIGPTRITSDTLYLFQINPDNSSKSTVLSSTTQNEALLPGPIIPDGQGGVLATWTISPSSGPIPQYPYQAVDVSAGVVGAPYNLPLSPTSVSFGQSPSLVLGENGVAFVAGPSTTTDGTNTVVSQVASFNISTGSPYWTYQATPGNTLSLIMATAGNGLVAKSTDSSGNDTVLTFNPGGTQAQQNASRRSFRVHPDGQQPAASQIDYYANGLYLGVQGSSTAEISLSLNLEAAAPGIRPKGDAQHNGTTDPGLVLVATQDCHLKKLTTQGDIVWGRIPKYSLRDSRGLLQELQCNGQQPQTAENRCYTVSEYIPEDNVYCTRAKGISPCGYSAGTPLDPYNEFDDEIALFQYGQALKTQYFEYGRPGDRTWDVYRIYRTLPDGSLQSKQPSPACQYCYQKNLLNIVFGADPLIDGYPDPWLAPWDGNPATCHDEGSKWFQPPFEP